MKIGFIGFGEAARAFRESLAAVDPTLEFAAFDILLDSEAGDGQCAAAMRAADVEIAIPADGLATADWIVSAVTADQSLLAAEAAAGWLRAGQVYFDINSVSPERKRRSADIVNARGAAYVDMAVMAPVHPRGHKTPVLIAGDAAGDIEGVLDGLGFDFDVVGSEPGAATAIKMVRSLFVKGLEAITVETLQAAAASSCFDYILKSLSTSFPGLGWPDFAEYQFERTLRHGRRRAAEMRESAATLNGLGLHGALANAIADIQEEMGRLGFAHDMANELPAKATQLARRRKRK